MNRIEFLKHIFLTMMILALIGIASPAKAALTGSTVTTTKASTISSLKSLIQSIESEGSSGRPRPLCQFLQLVFYCQGTGNCLEYNTMLGVAIGDEDGDGVLNYTDNCIFEDNADQEDWDKDGKGTPCDRSPADYEADECLITQ